MLAAPALMWNASIVVGKWQNENMPLLLVHDPALPMRQSVGEAPMGQAVACDSNVAAALHVVVCVTLQPQLQALVSSACEYHVALWPAKPAGQEAPACGMRAHIVCPVGGLATQTCCAAQVALLRAAAQKFDVVFHVTAGGVVVPELLQLMVPLTEFNLTDAIPVLPKGTQGP